MEGQNIHEEGFSLFELIIYVGIFSVVSMVFVGTITNLTFSWSRSKIESEVQQNMRFATQAISQTIRSAARITTPSSGGSGSSLTAVVNGQNVTYSLNGTVLQKQIDANPAETITTDKVKMTYLNFLVTENSATTTGSVITATATTTQFALKVEYNSTEAQFAYSQTATSSVVINQ